MTETLKIQGTTVHIDGEGPHSLLMLHGWPDTHRLWNDTVSRLAPHWRCVRVTLPGYEPGSPRQAASVDEIVALLLAVCERTSPAAPVTLVLHDWGCVFGYQFALRHPDRVAGVVGVDVGDAGSPAHLAALPARAKVGIAGYQLWLAAAWRLSALWPGLGDRMARWMARTLRCPTPAPQIHAGMGYPYDMAWTGSHGGMRKLAPPQFSCPMLYLYGRRKPLMFQSRAWLEALAARPGCRVQAMDTGHWVMTEQPAAFAEAVADWLRATG